MHPALKCYLLVVLPILRECTTFYLRKRYHVLFIDCHWKDHFVGAVCYANNLALFPPCSQIDGMSLLTVC